MRKETQKSICKRNINADMVYGKERGQNAEKIRKDEYFMRTKVVVERKYGNVNMVYGEQVGCPEKIRKC
jgi:hypothetical protein